nr:non-structural polyprotein [Flumine hepe-like virus 6]
MTGKAGQGISAWSKTINSLLGGVIRACATCLASSLGEKLVFVNAISDDYGLLPNTNIDYNLAHTISTDVSEFDAMQCPSTILFECLVMSAVGAPDWAVKLYKDMRTNWKLSARYIATAVIDAKKPSGEPATLYHNSITCAAIIACTFDLTNAQCFVKGDDFFAVSNEEFAALPSATALHLNLSEVNIKTEVDRPAQFINFFMTPIGPVPDIPRLVAKVKSKPLGKGIPLFKDTKWCRTSSITSTHHPSTSVSAEKFADVMEIEWIEPRKLMVFMESIEGTVHLVLTRSPRNAWILPLVASVMQRKLVVHVHEPGFRQALCVYQISVRDRLAMFKTPHHITAGINLAAAYYEIPKDSVERLLSWLQTFAALNITAASNYYHKIRSVADLRATLNDLVRANVGEVLLRGVNCGSNGWDCCYRVLKHLELDERIAEHLLAAHPAMMVDVSDLCLAIAEFHASATVWVTSDRDTCYIIGRGGPGIILNKGHYYAQATPDYKGDVHLTINFRPYYSTAFAKHNKSTEVIYPSADQDAEATAAEQAPVSDDESSTETSAGGTSSEENECE